MNKNQSVTAVALMKAAKASRPDALRKLLLAGGADPGIRDRNGWSALHAAAFDARADAVDLLLAAGASLDAKMGDGCTPLHFALRARSNINNAELLARIRIAKTLIEKGASIDGPDDDGRTALWSACYMARGKAGALVEYILQLSPDLRAVSKDRYTMLHVASVFGHPSVAKAALAAGVDVNARDEDGGTALLHAVFHDHEDIAMLLIAAGADVNAASSDGRTPLSSAAHQGHLHLAKLLVLAGAEPTPTLGKNAVEAAAWRRHGDILEYLLAHGGRPVRTLSIMAELGFSDGNMGATSRAQIIETLLQHGADLHQKNRGDTVLAAFLRAPASQWDVRAILALVKAGANLDVPVKPEGMVATTARKLLSAAPPALVRDKKNFEKARALAKQ